MSDAPKYCLGIVRWVEEPVNAPVLRALGAVPSTVRVPVPCALLPGHAGVCRCEEQLLQMIEAAAE